MDVGEDGDGSVAPGNGVRDYDEAGRGIKEKEGGETIEVEELEWTSSSEGRLEGQSPASTTHTSVPLVT